MIRSAVISATAGFAITACATSPETTSQAVLTRATYDNARHSIVIDASALTLTIDGVVRPLEDCSTDAAYCYVSGPDFAFALPKVCRVEGVDTPVEMRIGSVVPHSPAAAYYSPGRPFGFQNFYDGGGLQAIWYAPEHTPGSRAPWDGIRDFANWLPLKEDGIAFPCKPEMEGSVQ